MTAADAAGSTATGNACPACGSADTSTFHDQHGIPTNSCLLMASRDEALAYPTGDLRLARCHGCGFVFNVLFDKGLSEYSSRYEETQAFSPRFVSFARDLAKRWVDDHDLHDKTVLEIGCGKGEFLVMMAEAGVGHGIGIDPGVHPERIDTDVADRLEWIADFYSEKYSHLSADAVVCRHTLEHIPNVAEFMRIVRRAIGDRSETSVLFELPDVLRVLQEVGFWDVYYEHCSYFSLGSLARLFRHTGFEVHDLEVDYDDQYLLIEATPVPMDGDRIVAATGAPLAVEDDMDALADAALHYGREFETLKAHWQNRVRAVRAEGGHTVIWGGGSKGVSFLTNVARGDSELIRAAVDINPHKHGFFMAGTGHEVVAPESLVDEPPALVVAMNPVYLDEIRHSLDELDIDCALVAV